MQNRENTTMGKDEKKEEMQMIALGTTDLQDTFQKMSELVQAGEKVLLSRPLHENLVVLSETEYNALEKARRNMEYLEKIDHSIQQMADGRVVVKTMEELEEMAE